MKELILDYARLFYRTFRFLLRALQRNVPPKIACYIQNVFLVLHRSNLKYSYDKKNSLYIAHQDGLVRYFGDMDRGFDLYARCMIARGHKIANSYCLQNLNFNSQDIIIDCGANYGDLYIYFSDKIKKSNYIAFEPGPVEFKCLQNSMPNSRIYNLALSDSDGELDFYLCSKTGDSSLIEPKTYTEVIKVDVRSMDSFLPDLNIDKCKLFKIEAEGLEPEILNGSRDFIKICEYIAIDGGRERGVNAEATLHKASNFLLRNGFEMIDINGKVYRALYKNCFLS